MISSEQIDASIPDGPDHTRAVIITLTAIFLGAIFVRSMLSAKRTIHQTNPGDQDELTRKNQLIDEYNETEETYNNIIEQCNISLASLESDLTSVLAKLESKTNKLKIFDGKSQNKHSSIDDIYLKSINRFHELHAYKISDLTITPAMSIAEIDGIVKDFQRVNIEIEQILLNHMTKLNEQTQPQTTEAEQKPSA